MLALAGSATALATGLGAVPVFLLGLTRGGASAVPVGDRRSASWASRRSWACCCRRSTRAVRRRGRPALAAGVGVHARHAPAAGTPRRPRRRDCGAPACGRRVLVFAVLLVHSLPEGLAIGTAYASSTEGLGLFVILAIALQNVPEGTSVAIPMEPPASPRAAVLGGGADQRPATGGRVVAFCPWSRSRDCWRSRSRSRRAPCCRSS